MIAMWKTAGRHMNERMLGAWLTGRRKLREVKGQGTTEYAILVGVLVVIAIIALVAFRGRLEELWNDISDGINGL
jgi:Flp pilus assembly pilin Flp